MSSLPHQSTPKRVIKACYKAGLFMRHYQGDPMKPICPYCHSSDVISQSNPVSSIFEQLCSQATLTSLGVSICKYYKVNPAIGVITATAIASAVSVATRRAQTPLITTHQQNYLCQRCFKPFTL